MLDLPFFSGKMLLGSVAPCCDAQRHTDSFIMLGLFCSVLACSTVYPRSVLLQGFVPYYSDLISCDTVFSILFCPVLICSMRPVFAASAAAGPGRDRVTQIGPMVTAVMPAMVCRCLQLHPSRQMWARHDDIPLQGHHTLPSSIMALYCIYIKHVLAVGATL